MTDHKGRIYVTGSFKRDYKNLSKKHADLSHLKSALDALLSDDRNTLSTKYRDHALVGQWQGFRELHVNKDTLLVYRTRGTVVAVVAVRLASHDILFSKAITARDIREYLREAEELFKRIEERNNI